MSDASAAPQDPGVDPNADQTEGGAGGDQKEKTIPLTEFERVKSDMHKQKERARELEQKLKAIEEEKLKSSQKWEEVAKLKEKEAEEARKEAEAVKNSFISERRYSAVKEAALSAGLRKEALTDLDLLDMSELEIEKTSTGKIKVLGADRFVDHLKATKPHWFGAKQAPGVNTGTPQVVTSNVTTKQLLDAQKKARETGDWADYEKLVKSYRRN